jgi:predicted DNA-binding ribbon-helix-helix protein
VKVSEKARRNFSINGQRTSVNLEPEFWVALDSVARKRKLFTQDLVKQIRQEYSVGTLTGAIRVWLLQEGRNQ